MRMVRGTAVGTSLVALVVACGGGGHPSRAGADTYEEYQCPGPIGRIVREDCSKSALQYEGASFQASVGAGGVGASASLKENAIREADALVSMLKEQRVGLCRNFNTCKLTVAEYRDEQKRLDDSFVALLALKDRMAMMDAEGATKLLAEIQAIRHGKAAVASKESGKTDAGCADGEREGFLQIARFPDIAGCAGGWSVAGVKPLPPPSCKQGGGDDGSNPMGAGCSAADLCAKGWHVCRSSAEVNGKTGAGCGGVLPPDEAQKMFFATQESGPGWCLCGDGTDDLFGCGNLGNREYVENCGALPPEHQKPTHSCLGLSFSGNFCGALGKPWECGGDNTREASNVVKPSPLGGGVLCCRD